MLSFPWQRLGQITLVELNDRSETSYLVLDSLIVMLINELLPNIYIQRGSRLPDIPFDTGADLKPTLFNYFS
jgi:hypothetical protein